MDHINTHPTAEKLHVKFHNQKTKLGDARRVREQPAPFGKYADFSDLQYEFEIEDDFFDIESEFETQYEQFLTNIRGKSGNGAKR